MKHQTDHRETARNRLRRFDRLEAAISAKRAALLEQRRITGHDARRYVMLCEAYNRLCCLHPFHRVRPLP